MQKNKYFMLSRILNMYLYLTQSFFYLQMGNMFKTMCYKTVIKHNSIVHFLNTFVVCNCDVLLQCVDLKLLNGTTTIEIG